MRGRARSWQSNHSLIRVAQDTYITVSSETPPTWRATFLYLYPPGTGWPSYTPGYWVNPNLEGEVAVFISPRNRVHGSPPLDKILSQYYPPPILTTYFLRICLNVSPLLFRYSNDWFAVGFWTKISYSFLVSQDIPHSQTSPTSKKT
jgi:hypothetical protein